MFNKSLTVVAPTEHVTHEVTRHVHEHRAPTDDSVKLLKEMEGAAREKIVEALHVGDAKFECVVHMLRHYEDQSTSLEAIFSLNGHRMTARAQDHDWRTDKPALILKLRDAMAETIASEILTPALHRLR